MELHPHDDWPVLRAIAFLPLQVALVYWTVIAAVVRRAFFEGNQSMNKSTPRSAALADDLMRLVIVRNDRLPAPKSAEEADPKPPRQDDSSISDYLALFVRTQTERRPVPQ